MTGAAALASVASAADCNRRDPQPAAALANAGVPLRLRSRAIRRHLAAGEVRHIAGRLHTRNVTDPLEQVVRRRVWDIAAGYFPGATIVDRTAFEMKPAEPDGAVFLCGRTRRVVRLPGLVLNCRRGPSPAEGDTPFLGGDLYLNSWLRRFLDNMRPSRARGGSSRTLTNDELEDRLLEILAKQGEGGLNRLRDEARAVAAHLGDDGELAALDARIGALLGTRAARLASPRARAARRGLAWDDTRLPLFDALLAALNAHVPVDRPERPEHTGAPFAFFEAYFSTSSRGPNSLSRRRRRLSSRARFRPTAPPTRTTSSARTTRFPTRRCARLRRQTQTRLSES